MTLFVRSGILAISTLAAVTACSSRHDAVTTSVDPVGSVPVIAAPPESVAPDEPEMPSDPLADPTTSPTAGTAAVAVGEGKDVRTTADGLVGDGVRPEGFTTISAVVTSAEGGVCTVCLWLADVADERARGLMGVTDLGDAVGMAFAYDEPGDGAFVMIGTPTPLSIAWFDADGGLVNALDMEPCTDGDADRCTRYRADAPYELAIEMFQGELDAIGIGPGSRVELLPDTESAACPELD